MPPTRPEPDGGPEGVFSAVVVAASALLDDRPASLARFDDDGTAVVVAASDGPAQPEARTAAEGDSLAFRVRSAGRAERIDDDDRGAAVGVPVHVDGRLWGFLAVCSLEGPLPAGTEDRLARFTDIVAAAIRGADARRRLRDLADEQAALRRLAELAAREASVPEVLDAVAREASWLAGVSFGMVLRFEPDGATRIEALSGAPRSFRLGMRSPAEGDGSAYRVWRTGRAARADDLKDMSGTWPRMAHRDGYTSSAAAPMRIGDSLWGALVVVARDGPLPAGLEDHLADFCELAGTVIVAAENKAKLTASRARVVASADEARRRVQRDVHDTAQQRLVHAVITLKLARSALVAGRPAQDLVEESIRHAEQAGRDLRDAVRGIFPAALTRGGLRIGVEALVDDLPLPVDVRVDVPRLPVTLETTAYVVVAEALANVVKHAGATRAAVHVRLEPGCAVVDVEDDGSGGADPALGTGLTGLIDRVEAGAGTLTVTSPRGGGTVVRARLPLPR